MACWNLARAFDLDLDEGKLLKLALVHDLGEIDAGDTFLYSDKRADAHREERQCLQRLQQHPGNSIDELEDLWEEQETGDSRETRLLKAVDRLLPLLLNVANRGRTWRDLEVRRSQVQGAHAFIADEFPVLHRWIEEQINAAESEGWLIDD